MDNVTNETLFTTITSSGILHLYMKKDSELAELINTPNHPNIHFSQNPVSAKQITPTFKKRLEYMVYKKVSLNLEAVKQLNAFLRENPESKISHVAFNCLEHHYGVYLGITKNDIHAICVMTGGHIPDSAFENTLP